MAPIVYQWDGESFRPLPRYAKACDRELVVGQFYLLTAHEERSAKSQNHYFARIAELFDSMPESMAGQFLTPEHLRKYALIKSGYADEQFTSFSSEFDATRAAVMLRNVDDCSIVDVKGRVVRRYTAKSQTYKAMGRKDFQRSKEAVLGYIESLVGVNRSDNGEAA